MFAFTGLKPEMVEEMISKYSIHFTLDGRINLAGLNQKNIDIVCQAIHDVTKGKKL
jgi:aspartate/tyrosine/aromatic aminotransferase